MKTLDKPRTARSKTRRNPPSPYMPKTPLGKNLWALRQKYISEGGRLIDWEELEKEVALRKG